MNSNYSSAILINYINNKYNLDYSVPYEYEILFRI